MKKIVKAAFIFLIPTVFFTACTNDNLVPLYEEQKAGKIVIRGYNAMQDSLQIAVDGKILAVDAKHDAFVKKIEKNHEFVFYGNSGKTVEVINKKTKAVIHSYLFTSVKPVDTLSFYAKEEIWVSDVLSFKPGTLSATGRTGRRGPRVSGRRRARRRRRLACRPSRSSTRDGDRCLRPRVPARSCSPDWRSC